MIDLKTNLIRLRVFMEVILFPIVILELALLSIWLRPRKDTWYFVLNNHIGDLYIICSLMHSFKKIYGGRVAVILPKKYIGIAKLFKDIDEAIGINLFIPDYVAHLITLIKGRLVPTSIWVHVPPFSNLRSGVYNVLLASKINLGLPVTAEFSKPYVKKTDIKKVAYLISKFRTKKKKVLLIPFIHGEISPISLKLWQDLINYLNTQDYTVFVNSKKYFYGAINIYLPINLIIPFVKDMSLIISVRTGLVDIISSTQVRKIIIYDNKGAMNFFSIKNYKYNNIRSNIREIVKKDFTKIKSIL